MLRTKSIPLVKVLWKNHALKKASWEREDIMQSRYPDLFHNQGMYNFEDEIFVREEDCSGPKQKIIIIIIIIIITIIKKKRYF